MSSKILTLHATQIPLKQIAIRKPFFAKSQTIKTIRKTTDYVEQKKLAYPDYDKRKGIIWSDFFVNTQKPELIKECKNTIKLSLVEDTLQKNNPESIFTYPDLKNILCQQILPKTFALITTNGWAQLPHQIFAQFFLQRCHFSNTMHWHQDPGEDYDTMADFSLIIMLSKQNDPLYGWQGGEFKIRSGLPEDLHDESKVQTIVHEDNQAILFNNKIHSHMVTAITSENNQGKRDLIVLALYLGKVPKPYV
jgi:hypothetical protein